MAMKENSFNLFNKPFEIDHCYDTNSYFSEVFGHEKSGFEFREKQIKNRFTSFKNELDVTVAWENKALTEGEKITTIQVDDFVVASYAEGELVASAIGFNGWYRKVLFEDSLDRKWDSRLWEVSDYYDWASIDFFWLMNELSGEVSLEGNFNGRREDLYSFGKPKLYDSFQLGVSEEIDGGDGDSFMMSLRGTLLNFPDYYAWNLDSVWSDLDSDYTEQKSLFKIKVARSIDMSRFDEMDGPGKTRELVGAVFGTNGQA